MDIDELFGSGGPAAARPPRAGTSAGVHTPGATAGVRELTSVDDLFSAGRGLFVPTPVDDLGSSGAGRSSSAAGGRRRCRDDDEEEESDCDDEGERVTKPGVRLWDAATVHPIGVSNWGSTPNCRAALEYACPCGRACLSQVGGDIQLYEFRRKLRVRADLLGQGGLRDATREYLSAQYDRQSDSFRSLFVVGDARNVCERAAGVALGVSESVFGRARADVTKDRPLHGGRKNTGRRRRKRASLSRRRS